MNKQETKYTNIFVKDSKIFKEDSVKVYMEFIKISKEEYKRLKRLEKIDFELVEQFKRSLDDVKEGRIKRVA